MNQSKAELKRSVLFEKWLSPQGIQFESPESEKQYKANVTRNKDAIEMKQMPDRVPVCLPAGFFPVYHAGMTVQDVMYDYDKCSQAFRKFILDFQPDGHIGSTAPGPGKFYEKVDYKLYAWPGHGVAPQHVYQCKEGEYMKADEYDALIDDPTSYFTNVYLPRVFGALGGFPMLPAFTGILEMYGVAYNFIPFGLPPVQATYQALFEAGAEALKWAGAVGACEAQLSGCGYPQFLAGFTKAPFDVLGDTLRGTRGIMMDMYRRPEKLLEAMDRLVPIMIKMGVGAAQINGRPIIFIPLHKGADGFLSDEQFKKFYWPTLQKVMLGLIEQGIVPFPAAEGYWNTRLDVVQDLPRGTTVWMVDQSDPLRAKQTIGQNNCIMGNISSALLKVGNPEQVSAEVKRLIDNLGVGGGYIVSNGAFFDEAKPENVTAMVQTAKAYGVYH